MMETFTVEAIQRPLRQASRSHIVLSESGDVLTHRLRPGKRRLGKNQRLILKELVGGPMIPADLARVLWRPHQRIHEALQKLEREGLVISLGAPGQALHGTPVLRRLYALSPETCLIARSVPALTGEDFKAVADGAQLRGLLRQRLYEGAAKLGSPYLVKRGQGRLLLEQVRDEAQAALDAADPRLK